MTLSIPLTLETYAIWMAVWIAIWSFVGFVCLQVYWIRRAVHAYHELSPAERILKHAQHFRDTRAKPALAEMRRKWDEWRRNR